MSTTSWNGRWFHLRKVLERGGPLAHPDFQASNETLDFLLETCKILVVGAGGLGCELLKNLALMGFRNIHVIDMDTIDVSNLNRQFLFRHSDVGRPKAEVAANFINERIPLANVTAYYAKIQDYDQDFYSGFHVVVCGLDSIIARRWINGMLISLLTYEDGELDPSSVTPLVDGGTEGFKGNVRVILPGMNACIECTLDLFPPQINFPLCTIAHTPRLPEHCIEYARLLQWPKENPFGEEVAIDGDDPNHISWIYEKALQRAGEYGILGVTYRLAQGVVKHIIPAVASTNAVVAAACALEVFKLASTCAPKLDNYMVFNDTDGIYTYTYAAERNESCVACSQIPKDLFFHENARLSEVMEHLSTTYQMKSPGVTTTDKQGRNRTLYLPNVSSIEERTRPNLKKTLKELELKDGAQLIVADVTSPNAIEFHLKLDAPMDT
ncbi:NEDD8-activating enzyme E1 catalytic subunit-like [Daphnia pulicaria]|uniref:NEDD8-activating enzyme E1 catalytic subunit-like n=1 Tax=Daphnia pulicaria TaxID=35523 RepID=UPI001EEB0F0F|nr:NEDD8-activating enzyme E1 catalytic subunit-like [Daphnia pulicaria]XP_046632159.1 NEDD8-activating enzyme E1 catalytic subunit-like [Daphnia pulicaria]XP_046632160.1 NEDD8-activating enzyme E1 catalytic subunit-like [Daphnia pulicaria]XP_046632161.1 NEDD8-activating enzyme E1 catalytic subunit-like [Daphnia pulicaria]XP_046632162.1 NEDD8-activating enzyme E1 catalytic subunit-like [Daphnia pulicaria]XP_046632163.1 NEDD8-activating enzyme E1 catalytic subunit-like [Daphnia pulicaria]XP_04